MQLTVRHTNPNDSDAHVCPLTNRLTTAANAQPRGPASTTKPTNRPTSDDVQTVDMARDQRAPNLPIRRPSPCQNFKTFQVPAPMMGTDKLAQLRTMALKRPNSNYGGWSNYVHV